MKGINTLIEFTRRPEGFFVCVATLFGLLFMILIPPFQTPDEYTHFYRSYEVSELKTPSVRAGNELGSYLPASILKTQEAVKGFYGQIRSNVAGKYNHRYTKHSFHAIPLNESEKLFYATSSSPAYIPLVYTPQAVTIFIAKLFDSPIILMLYLVRLVNLVLWIAIVFCAIKILPWRKWKIALVALLPMPVAQSISPGIDVLVLGMSILFIALVVRSLNNKYVDSITILAIFTLGTIMTLGKPISAALLPLILIIPNSYFGKKWQVGKKILATVAPLLIYLLLIFCLDKATVVGDVNNSVSSASIQTSTFLSQPWIFVIELISTYFFVWGDSITQSLIGNFGWLDTPLSSPFITLGYIIIFILVFINYNERISSQISKIQKWFLILITVTYFCLTCLAMYIYSTDPTNNFISGIQGRYFIPVLVLLVLIFANSKVFLARRSAYIKVVSMAVLCLLSASVMTIFFRYYITYLQ